MKKLLCSFLLAIVATGSAQNPTLAPEDRAKLPEAARNLPFARLSSGALTLLNRGNVLVQPPSSPATVVKSETVPVTLDLRIGPNIRLGNDPPQLPANMRAQAEPHIARSVTDNDNLTATFQEGRFTDGGAVDVGFSITHDGGLTWSRALLPNLTFASGGPFFRATDPVTAYDLAGNIYISTDAATDTNFNNGVIAVSKSSDGGASFASPVVVYQPPDNTNFPDKEWIAVNTFPATSTAGRVLVTFTLFSNTTQNLNPIYRSYSDNGGATWSPIANVTGTGAGSNVQGSQPVYLPNGNCVIVYWNFGTASNPGERLECVISSDGGTTFSATPHLISAASEWNEPSIRSGGFLPAAAVDPLTGSINVVYQTVLNGRPTIAFAKSADGGFTWTTPIPISDQPSGLGVFNPAVAVTPGGKVLSAVFYDHRDNPSSQTLVNLYLAQSFDSGATWQPNIRLTSVTTDAALAPKTSSGYMLGDYLGVAPSTRQTVPAVPVWVDTRTGNPDPFITRAGIAPITDLATAWEAAHSSFANIPAASNRPEDADPDRDGEDNVSENASGTDPNNYVSVFRTGRELNISTRLQVGTDENVGIAGFVVSGSASKSVLIRALGPSLAAFNVPGVLLDPVLQLFDVGNNLIASNDNWRDTQQSEIQATGLAPGDDREAAIIQALPPGAYTAIIRGAANSGGSGLIEVYDLEPDASSILTNISTRATVGIGDFVPIGGFVVGRGRGTNADGSSQVLVRAIGPELANFNVSNPLKDPTLELFDANGNQIATNDNWKDSQAAAITATGHAPSDDREAAILATLVQGNWTTVMRGKNGTTGVGLIEVYRIQ